MLNIRLDSEGPKFWFGSARPATWHGSIRLRSSKISVGLGSYRNVIRLQMFNITADSARYDKSEAGLSSARNIQNIGSDRLIPRRLGSLYERSRNFGPCEPCRV